MSKFKKITFLWILSISVFLIFNFLIFFNYTSKVYPDTADTTIGDLARMSYSVDIIQERENITDLEKLHLYQNQYNYENIDMVTIGDSFSNGGAGGKNRYYQDYISTIYNKKVLNLNIQNYKNYLEIIAFFANSGYLEKIGAKYVLIESVQREALVRFARNDLNLAIKTDKNLETIFRNSMETYNIEKLHNLKPSIINNLNLNAFIYNIKYYIKGYGKLNSSVYIEKLNKDLFTSKSSSKLAFYHEDIKKLSLETKENIELLNHNFNNLADILESKGIKLIFMPAVDKYNLYRPYIISNNYSESIFFEYLSTLDKKYIFINTKEILSKNLENSEKDIFYADDTHWSYKASINIIESEAFNNIFKKGE
ncbi:hypothetical protein [Aliarcobacter cryaerophilus]|jgi:hypothetical protein|uniref:hypothetical protein n=1 Tax=Aliarcobacter cryaerophilus TaxID=28198 RepID=UPI0016544296|nr:hypothetical protein [Aliarcobacter cryaerophilus]MCT7510752.1 hypothetical protein [Aliarcobacter cryaerophilus]QNM92776.1 hypothetical protein HOO33_02780 [Aliarcobacter cryaerophilus]